MSLDLNRITALLHVAEVAQKWPKLNHLHHAAMRELENHAKAAEEEHKDRLEAEKQKQAAKAEAEQAALNRTKKVEVPDPPGNEPTWPEEEAGADITSRVHGDVPGIKRRPLESTSEERPE